MKTDDNAKKYLNEFYGDIYNIDNRFENYKYFRKGLKKYFFNIIVFLLPGTYMVYRRFYLLLLLYLITKLVLLIIVINFFNIHVHNYDDYIKLAIYYLAFSYMFISLFFSLIVDHVAYKKFEKIYNTLKNDSIDEQKKVFKNLGARANILSKLLTSIIYVLIIVQFTFYYMMRILQKPCGWADDAIILGIIIGIFTLPVFLTFLKKFA